MWSNQISRELNKIQYTFGSCVIVVIKYSFGFFFLSVFQFCPFLCFFFFRTFRNCNAYISIKYGNDGKKRNSQDSQNELEGNFCSSTQRNYGVCLWDCIIMAFIVVNINNQKEYDSDTFMLVMNFPVNNTFSLCVFVCGCVVLYTLYFVSIQWHCLEYWGA